ncbi:MAG: sigma-54-dependent Fis family transcriptional regulator [Hydrogenophilales bacterium]|nr:sigma-54-dependent Fis family transcriptional regulator [Hydrogenophilales bacterium]
MTSLQVLVVDDEPAIRQVLAAHLRKAGYSVEQAGGGNAALERLFRGDVDVALCDINMPDMSGIELLRQARASGIDTAFIMMTAYASVDTAIEAMKAGAADYMIKPLNNEELLHRLSKVGDLRGLRAENQVLRKLVLGAGEEVFSFNSPAMREVERMVAKVSPTNSTVLITGESGTGKGVAARHIHQQSQRADAPFIPVNCGAIPENLVESELFGHTRGAFTGADKARKGLFLEADRGTIFLDEVGELPLALQVKLLHVIEHKEVRPVGSEQARRVNVRIVAATNRDLGEMVAQGKFRQDLFFRLSVFHIHMPPLRERRQDLPALVRFLLQRSMQRLGNGHRLSVDPAVEDILLSHDWPGNVRELENTIDRALIMAEGGHITLADLPPQITKVAQPPHPGGGVQLSGTLREQVRKYEAVLILRTIEEAGGDRRAAANILDIGLSSLYRKLEEIEAQGLLSEGHYSHHEIQQI